LNVLNYGQNDTGLSAKSLLHLTLDPNSMERFMDSSIKFVLLI
jgi:hypothetical protein